MSTLERVIAEQQTEIDGMKIVIASQQKSLFTVFTRNTELFEKFGELLDKQVPDRTNETAWKRYHALRFECRRLMTDAGFCCRCRNFVCECEYE